MIIGVSFDTPDENKKFAEKFHFDFPLLCDTDIYKRTHPDTRLPRHRFTRPEDAREQLDRAVRFHEQLFGARPSGLWPSEGSVSDAIVPLVETAGFQGTDLAVISTVISRMARAISRSNLEGGP